MAKLKVVRAAVGSVKVTKTPNSITAAHTKVTKTGATKKNELTLQKKSPGTSKSWKSKSSGPAFEGKARGYSVNTKKAKAITTGGAVGAVVGYGTAKAWPKKGERAQKRSY